MTNIAIRGTNLSKYFSKNPNSFKSLVNEIIRSRGSDKDSIKVLENINFEVQKGEFIGLLGKNGSGKSTLLKLIAGITKPSNGNLSVNGKVVPFLELGVGFKPNLTALDNIFLNGAILGIPQKILESKLNDILEFSGLKNFENQLIKNFSSGMRIRLGFAIAIQSDADIYLLDEVFAVGDKEFRKKSLEKMEELLSRDCTVVMTSHDESKLKQYADRIINLEEINQVESGVRD